MRGEHYCIALALMIDGQPRLSVLGCPNLHLNNTLAQRQLGVQSSDGSSSDSSSAASSSGNIGSSASSRDPLSIAYIGGSTQCHTVSTPPTSSSGNSNSIDNGDTTDDNSSSSGNYIIPPTTTTSTPPTLPPTTTPTPTAHLLTVFPPTAGSIFFAVTNRGAYARSLYMPFNSGFEVSVSSRQGRVSLLCESAEATHGDRGDLFS